MRFIQSKRLWVWTLAVLLWLAAGAAGVLCSAQETPATDSRYWTWTEPAEHHKAIVTVQQGASRGVKSQGVGCLVWKSEDNTRGMVATCAHAVEQGNTAMIIFRSFGNQASVGPVVTRDAQADCALVMVDPPDDCPVVRMAKPDEFPVDGTLVECTGYGGPADKLRHWWARLEPQSTQHALTLHTSVLSGDSGGPVFHKLHDDERVLVGVIWGGKNRGQPINTSDGERWHLVYPAEAAGMQRIREIWTEAEGRMVAQPTSPRTAQTAVRPVQGRYNQPPVTQWQNQAGGAYCPPGGT